MRFIDKKSVVICTSKSRVTWKGLLYFSIFVSLFYLFLPLVPWMITVLFFTSLGLITSLFHRSIFFNVDSGEVLRKRYLLFIPVFWSTIIKDFRDGSFHLENFSGRFSSIRLYWKSPDGKPIFIARFQFSSSEPDIIEGLEMLGVKESELKYDTLF